MPSLTALLPLLALLAASARATTCPKPAVDIPAGPIDPLVISGTATAPCGLIDIYIDGQFMYVDGASGPSYENGAPLTFSYKNDLHIPYGEKKVKVQAVDGSGEFASSWSDEVSIIYGV